jgi:hypothetical protein
MTLEKLFNIVTILFFGVFVIYLNHKPNVVIKKTLDNHYYVNENQTCS